MHFTSVAVTFGEEVSPDVLQPVSQQIGHSLQHSGQHWPSRSGRKQQQQLDQRQGHGRPHSQARLHNLHTASEIKALPEGLFFLFFHAFALQTWSLGTLASTLFRQKEDSRDGNCAIQSPSQKV